MGNLMKQKRQIFWIVLMTVVVILMTTGVGFSQVTGPCVGCHTMHNSQDGAPMATNVDGTPDASPNAKLLKRDGCLGCHSGAYSTSGTVLDAIPKVLALSAPTPGDQDYAAGGNFYWVAQTGGVIPDAKGHNVGYVRDASDATFTDNIPPGYDTAMTDRRGPFDASHQLTCAGTYGCHGVATSDNDYTALTGAHHGVENANGFSDGTTIAKSYRFLMGIKGVESADWEYSGVSATNHNQYHGEDRDSNAYSDTTTISHLCCKCHGIFHTAADATFASPWIRHPTDFDLSNATGTEYEYYNAGNGTDNDYSPIAPVAADMSGCDDNTAISTMTVSKVFGSPPAGLTGKDIAIVTCISCHRAHGSEYADILRWDYSTMNAGGTSSNDNNNGCFICHTTKDDNS